MPSPYLRSLEYHMTATEIREQIERDMFYTAYQPSTPEPEGRTSMNLSAAVMLFEENGVRPCRVVYDPDIARNNNPDKLFKCVDPSVKKDDLVIVTTSTRHGFTVAKVEAIGYADVPVDFESGTPWGWVAAKFDSEGFDAITTSEKALVGKVSEANANKLRNDLKQSMGLGNVSLADVFIKAPAALASPHGAPQAAAPAIEPGTAIPTS